MIESGWGLTDQEKQIVNDVRIIQQRDIPNIKAQMERMAKAIEKLNTSIADCTSAITQLKADVARHEIEVDSLCHYDAEICIINERLGRLKDRLYNLSDF